MCMAVALASVAKWQTEHNTVCTALAEENYCQIQSELQQMLGEASYSLIAGDTAGNCKQRY